MEVCQLKKRLQGRQANDREHGALTGQPGPQQQTQDIPRKPAGSTTVFSEWPSRALQEQKSAFSKAARYLSGKHGLASIFQASRPADVMKELLGLIKMVDFPCWVNFPILSFWWVISGTRKCCHRTLISAVLSWVHCRLSMPWPRYTHPCHHLPLPVGPFYHPCSLLKACPPRTGVQSATSPFT